MNARFTMLMMMMMMMMTVMMMTCATEIKLINRLGKM